MHIYTIKEYNEHLISHNFNQKQKISHEEHTWPKIPKTNNQSKILIPIHNVGDIEAYKRVYYHQGASIQPQTS